VTNPWTDGTETVWRLGDIINSKPIIVGQPPFNYDHLYGDKTYASFKMAKGARRQVAYFGSNDGFLHAINMGYFGSLATGQVGFTGGDLGQERWALIPGSILPHLQWLADPQYIHSYYVDLKPTLADIKTSNGNWLTVLICGLRLGGRPIEAPTSTTSAPKNFYSEIFALDVTDPEAAPRLLWRFSAQELGLSVGLPAVVHSDGKWYAVLSSGPAMDFRDAKGFLTFGGQSPYDGHSAQKARLFVLNAENGSLLNTLTAEENNSFFSDPYVPISLKRGTAGSWNDETIYYGLTVSRDNACLDKGGVYRLQMVVPADNNPDTIDGAPLPVNSWTLKRFISVDRPVTGAVNSSLDNRGNLWVIFATGRLWGVNDIIPCADSDTAICRENHEQYLFGVKENLINGRMTFEDKTSVVGSLLDVSEVKVFDSGAITGLTSSGIFSYNDLANSLKLSASPGYKRRLNMGTVLYGTDSSEIALTQPKITSIGVNKSILGLTTYEPKVESCGESGQGYMYVIDPYSGVPGTYLSASFKLIDRPDSKNTIYGNVISGGASMGLGQPSEDTFVIVGNKVVSRASTTENSIRDIEIATEQKTLNNIISWREVFNTGFNLPKNIMSDDLNLQP
jgi:type IV pilus assembly protein PilY1